MKFKKLRLHGFKSFADPAELLFDDGLTAIVGPNGCGKSNLLEALRWVMGESRAKTVRGEGMEDVIFAGADKRAPRSFAEVALTVDNRLRTAPERFNDSDEIEISRKIVKEHGSVYRINGKEVRARDIQAMFADASTGSASPALVRQGQINELIQAKPKQRKKIIEDAAGVGGLYARRREAEDGLEAATRNLETVEELCSNNEHRIGVLRKQSEKAKKYREVAKKIRELEIKRIEILYFKAKFEKNHSEKEANEAILRAVRADQAQTAAFLEEEEMLRAFEPVKREISIATAILRGKESEAEKKSQEAETARIRIENLQSNLEILKKDAFREAEILTDARKSLQKTRDIQEEALTEEKKEDPQALEALENACVIAREEMRNAEIEIDILRDRISAAVAQKEQAQKQLLQLKSAHFRLEAEFLKAVEAENFLQKKINAEYDFTASKAEILRFSGIIQENTVQIEKIEQEKNGAKTRYEQSKEKYEAVRRELLTTEAEMKGLIALTEKSAVHQRAAENLRKISVRPGYEKAFAAALREGGEYDNNPDEEKYWGDAIFTKVDFPEHVTPLSRFTETPAYLTAAITGVGVIDEDAFQSAPFPPLGCIYVTLSGKVKRFDGFVERAPDHRKSAVMLEQRNLLSALQERFYEVKEKMIRTEAMLAEDQSEFQRFSDQLQKMKRDEDETRVTLSKIEKNVHEKEKEFAALNAQLIATTERKNAYAEEAAAALSRLKEAAAQSEEAAGLEQDKQRLDTLKESLTVNREKNRSFSSEIDQFKNREKQRRQSFERLEKEIKEWEDRASISEKRSNETRNRIEKLQKELTDNSHVPEQLTEEHKILAQEMKTAFERVRVARKNFETTENALFLLKKNYTAAQKEIAEANEDKARKETRFQAVQEKFDGLIDTIREMSDTHQIDLSRFDCADDEISSQDLSAIEEELKRTLKMKENIGAVNLLAESELSQAEAETGGLLYEKNDLSEAILKLRNVIKQLNDEGREKIMKAFHSVNEKFIFLFQSLFNGGEAGLELVESDDPLEAGLEIFAMPPGKKTKYLSLLSGGEQALTCTALIFAVFLTGPAPVCVLDEVDAPLDDANTERFCRLIREMTNLTETRFIVITHRPLTMANADRLFGVTMAEKGVSALVSVDLSAAEQLILT